MDKVIMSVYDNSHNFDDDSYSEILIYTPKGIYRELNIMSLDSWSIEDYQRQWIEGIERLKTHDISCLVANAQNIKKYPLVNIWPLFKVGDHIFVQNRLLLANKKNLKELKAFSVENCYNYITPRRIVDEDGEKIMEWNIEIE